MLKNLYSEESCGASYGHFKMEIKVDANVDLDADPIREATYQAAKLIKEAILGEVIKNDPEAQKRSATERQQLVGLFSCPIFVEEIPNGYCSDFCCKHLPWFVITTSVGKFTIGWRKRVISIDWTGTHGTKTSDELFASEDVTKGERDIHAWSVADAQRYVNAIISTAHTK